MLKLTALNSQLDTISHMKTPWDPGKRGLLPTQAGKILRVCEEWGRVAVLCTIPLKSKDYFLSLSRGF